VKRARVTASAVVLGAVALAAAAGGGVGGGNGSVTATPSVVVVVVPTTSPASGTVALHNTTAGPITITTIMRDPTCTTGDPTSAVGVSPSSNIVVGTTIDPILTVTCAGNTNNLNAMRRCLFRGFSAGGSGSGVEVVDFEGVCEYATGGSLSANPTSFDFGSVAVGASSSTMIQIIDNSATQVSRLSFQIDDLAGNFVVGMPCNPDAVGCDATIPPIGQGSGTFVVVKCSPTSVGPHAAQLFVDSDNQLSLPTPVMLTCNGTAAGGPVISVTPSTVTLSAQAGGGTATSTIHVSNIGSGGGVLGISSITISDVDPGASGDWSFMTTAPCATLPCTLAAGTGFDVPVGFAPTAIGSRHARMTIAYDDGAPKTTTVELFGTGLGATLVLVGGQTTIDFGVVPDGMTASVQFQLANTGNEATTATLTIDQGPFTAMPTPSMVTPGPASTFTVSCMPGSPGLATGMLTATGSPVFGTPPVTIALRCTGTSSALFAVPSTIAFGEVRTGTPAQMQSIQLRSAATGGQQLMLSGNPTLDMANANLSVGPPNQLMTPATFAVTATPHADGDLADKVDASATDSASDTVQVPISGHVVTASYSVPASLDLGTYCVGQQTTASSIALMSTGTATIGLPSAPALGASSPFQLVFVSPPAYPTMLAPGTTARVSITPNRQSNAGSQADTLTWTTDVAGMTTATTMLTAAFRASGAAIAPGHIDFGSVPAHTGSAQQTVSIQNCNSTAITLGAPMLTSTSSPNPFAIVGTVPMQLAANATTTFVVQFTPTTIGHFDGSVTIISPEAGTLAVALAGDATGGGSGGDGGMTPVPGPQSFYACACSSSGGPSTRDLVGGMLVALAVACVVMRRRRSV
jgi:hypothetical protein